MMAWHLSGRRPWFGLLLIGLLGAPLCCSAAAEESAVFRVFAGEYPRENTPVFCSIPAAMTGTDTLTLTRLDNGSKIAVQRLHRLEGPRLAWIVRQRLEPGQHRDYQLTLGQRPETAEPAVTVDRDKDHLLVQVRQKPVLKYNHREIDPPPGIEPIYRRSGHIHPLFNPAGQPVTDDLPPDHPHQHAVFFPWVRTEYDGRRLDFWNQAGRTAKIEHARFEGDPVSGPVLAEFVSQLKHLDITDSAQPVEVLHESWTVRVYDIEPYFLIDLISCQRCATDKPLKIAQHRYGGMAVRGSRQWFDAETASVISRLMRSTSDPAKLASLSPPRDYLTSEGKTWVNGNATRARWVEMHGMVDGQATGFTVMCHPDNFRAPQPVRLHPHKPYFCFAPMILGPFELAPGDEFISQYRFYVHVGGPDAAESERLWRDYAFPPQVVAVGS